MSSLHIKQPRYQWQLSQNAGCMTSINSSLQSKLALSLSLRNENEILGAKRGQEVKVALKGEGKLSFVGEGAKNPVKSDWKK